MDFYRFPPIAAALDAAYSVVTALSDLVAPIAGSAAAAVAIVLVTLFVRSLLIPVGVSHVRADFTRRRLAPHLQELQRRYKKKPEVLQRKTLELYAAEKASPFAGILPALAQAPVLSVVYGLFTQPAINGHANALLVEHLGTVPLGSSLFSLVGGGALWPGIAVFVVLLAIIGVVAFLSRRIQLRLAAPPTDDAPAVMRTMTAWLSWLPFITVAFAAIVPLAATLYLAVSTTWTLVERIVLRRLLAPRAVAA